LKHGILRLVVFQELLEVNSKYQVTLQVASNSSSSQQISMSSEIETFAPAQLQCHASF